MLQSDLIPDVTAFGGVAMYLVVIGLLFFYDVQLFYSGVIGLVLAYLVAIAIRYFYFKERPEKRKHSGLVGRIDASSFPSLHAMRATMIAYLLCVHVFFGLERVLVLAAWLGVCITRVILKKHDSWDVVGGVVIGLGLAYIVF